MKKGKALRKRWASALLNLFKPSYKQQKDNRKMFQRAGYTLFI